MKLYKSLFELGREKKEIRLAAGFFDGVHRGHQAIIQQVLQEARGRGEAAWIMTFDIHPLKLLQPRAAPPLLTSTAHKIRLIESYGAQGCVVLPFTRAMAGLGAKAFIEQLVRAVPNLRGMVVGHNWTFGKNRSGTPALLKKLGVLHGFGVSVVRPRRWRGGLISSTRIRRAVTSGKLEEAAAMLGRTYSMVGTVVIGRGIGRRLGVPTANLRLHNEVIPPDGVYAVRAAVNHRQYDGVANIGVRPTFSSGRRPAPKVLEVHLFDTRSNIRRREIEVVFIKKLRAERRFATPPALKARILRDIKQAKKIIKKLALQNGPGIYNAG